MARSDVEEHLEFGTDEHLLAGGKRIGWRVVRLHNNVPEVGAHQHQEAGLIAIGDDGEEVLDEGARLLLLLELLLADVDGVRVEAPLEDFEKVVLVVHTALIIMPQTITSPDFKQSPNIIIYHTCTTSDCHCLEVPCHRMR